MTLIPTLWPALGQVSYPIILIKKPIQILSLMIYVNCDAGFTLQEPISMRINGKNRAQINRQLQLQIFTKALRRHTYQKMLIGKMNISTLQKLTTQTQFSSKIVLMINSFYRLLMQSQTIIFKKRPQIIQSKDSNFA